MDISLKGWFARVKENVELLKDYAKEWVKINEKNNNEKWEDMDHDTDVAYRVIFGFLEDINNVFATMKTGADLKDARKTLCMDDLIFKKTNRCILNITQEKSSEEETVEDLINTLPSRIEKVIKEKCICGVIREKKIVYELEIRIQPHVNCNNKKQFRYLIFYRTSDFTNISNAYIGQCSGFGFTTIKGAVEDLKRYIK